MNVVLRSGHEPLLDRTFKALEAAYKHYNEKNTQNTNETIEELRLSMCDGEKPSDLDMTLDQLISSATSSSDQA